MTPTVYDARRCDLGEGPLWHPKRQELFWFDIIGKTLHSQAQLWSFDEHVSAAG
ncbi:MAG: SMP-30/gluconolactonase/LRE family protein, partial [Pseudomonadota bacterium]